MKKNIVYITVLFLLILQTSLISEKQSDGQQEGTIVITYPTDGDMLEVGSNPIIKYTSVGNSGYLDLDYSTDGGITWETIATHTTDNGEWDQWIVPNTPSTNCVLRVTDSDGNPSALNSGFFTIKWVQFSELTTTSLTGVHDGAAAWGDYDNDGDLDIVISGLADSNKAITKIYRNEGHNKFTEQSIILPTAASNLKWGDYNNDGYIDLMLISGGLKVYSNLGNNIFTEQFSMNDDDFSAAAWGDYNNDGYLDILVPGMNKSIVLRSDGKNSFIEQNSIILPAAVSGSANWVDYDNDGDLDILLTGFIDFGPIPSKISKIYRNNGDNTFTEQSAISLIGVGDSWTAWGDYDNDGYLDLILTGLYGITNCTSTIYKNNGDNTFTDIRASLQPVAWGSAEWGDYDNDGDLDILITGNKYKYGQYSAIYRNDGNNIFTEQYSINLAAVNNSSAVWGDYDNDDDLDILLIGNNEGDKGITKIYRNNNDVPNSPPSTPQNLQALVSENNVTLSWDKSSDNQTPQNGLEYNLLITTNIDSVNILSPMADRETGYRRIINLGNTHHNNNWTVRLPNGQYYWSVQAIDNCFAGSDFANLESFNVQSPGTIKITSPRGGAIIAADSNLTITYYSMGTSGYLNLDYSIDGGLTWDTIATNTPDNGEWNQWIVPNTPSTNCKIRITDSDGVPSVISDSTFTIFPFIPVELISFTAYISENKVRLSWATASEKNNKGFEIERASVSEFGATSIQHWKKIGFVNGAGTSSKDNTYTFADNSLKVSDDYSYRLKQIDYNGSFTYSKEIIVKIDLIPEKFALGQNYPNPFNPNTKIKYSIPSTVMLSEAKNLVTLKIYDVLGNKIATLVNENKPAGTYEIEFDGGKLSSGVYYYQLKSGSYLETKKMMLLR
jgi:hypothetical protein